jgi:hypothetical protein
MLELIAHRNYPFAYALFPDELMATQLLIDSLTKMALVFREDNERDFQMNEEDFELTFLKMAYELSIIRADHFRESRQLEDYNHNREDSSFYSLDISVRACLFIKDKMKLSFHDLAYIMGLPYQEGLSLVHRSRTEFLELLEYGKSGDHHAYSL